LEGELNFYYQSDASSENIIIERFETVPIWEKLFLETQLCYLIWVRR